MSQSHLGRLYCCREQLDNLIFVVNCNLQRLMVPFGVMKIIQELERTLGNGWCVIKVVWNAAWLEVIANDPTGQLMPILEEMVDGAYQQIADDRAMIAKLIFDRTPELKRYFQSLPSELIDELQWGGHDYVVHAALKEAKAMLGNLWLCYLKQ